jgi:hypothetical protein
MSLIQKKILKSSEGRAQGHQETIRMVRWSDVK